MNAASGQGAQLETLRDKGYVVVPGFLSAGTVTQLNQTARLQLAARAEPIEFEADLQYPGAPPSRTAAGGETVRRLLDAYGRDPAFAACATAPGVRAWMEDYFREEVLMSRAHHNCVMTKHPRHGSLTNWHRDIRYWSFEREDLVSIWIALGAEYAENGGLWFVPASHRLDFGAERFDEARFFRADRADNSRVLRSAESPRLTPGDAVFFHCKTLHSAGQNHTDQVKFSLVYTFHGRSNPPKPQSRSASKAEVVLK